MNTEGSDKMNVEYGTLNTTNTLIKTCMDVIWTPNALKLKPETLEINSLTCPSHPDEESRYREITSLSPFAAETIINKCLGYPLISEVIKSHKANPHNANLEALIIAVQENDASDSQRIRRIAMNFNLLL